eukprot:XP_764970.1 hypothetical protein [Theileria parva strain Muguga]
MSEKDFDSPDELDENLASPASVEECLSKATAFKSAGNEFYKLAKFQEASDSYNSGVSWMKKMSDFEPSHRELLSVLYSNLCATYLELSNYSKAREAANDAISNNKNNIKAYYRRAQALFNIGLFEEALEDCNYLLEIDKSDPNVNNLLRKINLKLKQANQLQKKVFGGLFDKVGGLYDDRQREMQDKKQQKYQEYLTSQREKGEAEMDYEAWERYEELESAKKEAERAKKAKAEGETAKKSDETPDFDEEDEKIINETKKMGYCYFGEKINNTNLQANTLTPQSLTPNSNVSHSYSLLTYLHNMTQWCKKTLEQFLLESSYQNEPTPPDASQNILQMFNDINLEMDGNGLCKLQKLAGLMCRSSVRPSSVEALEGDAQIAFIRGTRRYLFDFSCNVNLNIQVDTGVGADAPDDSQLSKYQVVLVLREISSERESGKSWVDYMSVKYKSKLKPEHQELVKDILDKYKQNVSLKIDQFLTHYQTQ